MNDVSISPVWYYTTTWDDLVIGKINIKYIIK